MNMARRRWESPGPEATRGFGRRLGRLLGPGDLVGLVGPLGSGKTCLARGIIEGLGVQGPIPSPTFTLIHQYRGRLPVYHFDLYRLEDPRELEELGAEDYFYGDGVTIVEWADRAGNYLPPSYLRIELERVPDREDNVRRVVLSPVGEGYLYLVKGLLEEELPAEELPGKGR